MSASLNSSQKVDRLVSERQTGLTILSRFIVSPNPVMPPCFLESHLPPRETLLRIIIIIIGLPIRLPK